MFLSFYYFDTNPVLDAAFFIKDYDLSPAEGWNLFFVKTSFFLIYIPREIKCYLFIPFD